jgi:hypothetical protein
MAGPLYFAWCGGSIVDKVEVVTIGTLHGGILHYSDVVADTHNGRQQLFNMSSSGLEVGALYRCEGPGIPADTYFIYDTSALVGDPGSVNLTQITPNDVLSGTFRLTASMVVGQLPATVSRDATAIDFGQPLGIPPGLYAIAGDPIGYTQLPVGTVVGSGGTTVTTSGTPPQISVPSAMFNYDGASSVVSLFILAAKSYTVTGTSGGQPTSVTTWDVIVQGVKLNDSGLFAFKISGMPDADWYSVTNIPADALAGLTPGLQYNISGPGLPVGTTFIAPDAGATSIELDQPASASAIGAILTITGPRTPNAPFDPTIHNRFDEDVLSIEIAQSEGDFATLNVDIKNQGIGFLATGRNLWCWLSYDRNWGGTNPPDLHPLFNGRLVGVPKLARDEVAQLQFVARPDDFNSQKLALASSMAVLPFYDPVFLTSAEPNPDNVLEAYSALWHTDRTTLEVTASDIIEGEDGTITIGEDQAFYDAFSLSFGSGGAPLRQVGISATVSWQQEGEGLVDVTGILMHAFRDAGNSASIPFSGSRDPRVTTQVASGGALVATLNGEGLKGSWPKPGTGIGGGWAVATGTDPNGQSYSYMLDATQPIGWMQQLYYNVFYTGPHPASPQTGGVQSNFNVLMAPLGVWTYTFALNYYKIRMMLEYHASRKRTETVRAVLVSDLQDEITDSAENDREEISLTSDFVANGIDPGSVLPIGTPLYRSYFQTDRGAGSFEYLLLLARAKLRARARSVDVGFAVDWATALGIGLRNNVTLFDRRLPGGSATGKVKHYRILVGEAGMWGEFTMGCTIGNGQPITAAAGVNSYVDDGYVDPGYQVVAGAQYMLLTDELAYQTLDQFAIADDGLNLGRLTPEQAVNFCTVTNGLTKQIDVLRQYSGVVMPIPGLSNPFDATKNLKTTVTLDLKPVAGGEYHTDFMPAVTLLAIPQTIDLAAPPGESMWDATHPAGESIWDTGTSDWDQPPPRGETNG